ncbi:hypothetical protein LXL04_032698 [Taraxacum kok-saghyz]
MKKWAPWVLLMVSFCQTKAFDNAVAFLSPHWKSIIPVSKSIPLLINYTNISDVYSFGVILFEILCGRLGFDADFKDERRYISKLVENKYNKGKLDEIVFEGIKEQIAPKSLLTFQSIARRCLRRDREKRPTTGEVVLQLEKALELQGVGYVQHRGCLLFNGLGLGLRPRTTDRVRHQTRLSNALDHGPSPTSEANFSVCDFFGRTESEAKGRTESVVCSLSHAIKRSDHGPSPWSAVRVREDYDMWKPKLPKDYENLVQKSNYREIYSTEKYEDLYNTFCKGILIQEGNVFFSLGSNGEGNEMISATKFSYKHRRSYKWRYLSESRFSKVAKMLDISNLKIQVKIKPQFISSDVSYGVYLVFKFCEPRKSVAKRMYANLKYKKGSETLHTYFATRREDGWMMIELCRFSNHKKDTDFEFLLESFSRCYCESCAVYLEGIEFLAIDNQVQHEESNNLKEVQVPKTKFNMDQLFSQNIVNKRKCNIVSAKEALYVYSDVKLSNTKPSVQYTSWQIDHHPLLSVIIISLHHHFQTKLAGGTQKSKYKPNMNNRAMPPSEQTSPDSTTAIAPSGDRYSSSSPSICFNSIGLSSASDTFPVAAPTCCLHCNQYRQHLHLPCEDLLLRARRCCTRRFFFLPVVVAFPVLLPARGESDPDAFNLLHLESKSQTRSFIFFISNPNPKPDPIPEIPDPDAFNLWFCPGESEEGAASVLSFSQSKALVVVVVFWWLFFVPAVLMFFWRWLFEVLGSLDIFAPGIGLASCRLRWCFWGFLDLFSAGLFWMCLVV